MRLLRPSAALRDAFLDVAREWRAADNDRYALAIDDFDAWLARMDRHARWEACPAPLVPCDHYWLVNEDDRILGGVRLRHALSRSLLVEGGHIGYDVRPSERRKGLGTRLLALTLEKARARGLERVLVTCDHDNVASARIIEKNGGVEITTSISRGSGKVVRRFWIDLEKR